MSEPLCPVCALAEHPTPDVVFVNDDVIVVVPDHALAFGHVQIFPRSHAAIFEHLSQDKIEPLFSAANVLSSVLFELTHAQGTNIIVQNGVSAGQSVAHVSVHVIARKEGDGIDFQWKMSKSTPEELKDVAGKIKDHFVSLKDSLGVGEKKIIDMDRKPLLMRQDLQSSSLEAQAEERKSIVAAENAAQDVEVDAEAIEEIKLPEKRRTVYHEKTNYLLKHLQRMP